MDHPAESVIVAAVDSEDPDAVLRWIRSFCLDSSNPAFTAAVFVCVARQPGVGTARWREELVRGGLAVDEVEVRDAAMQAASGRRRVRMTYRSEGVPFGSVAAIPSGLAEAFPSAAIAAFAVVRTISGVVQLPQAFDPVPEGQGHIVLNADGSTLRTPA